MENADTAGAGAAAGAGDGGSPRETPRFRYAGEPVRFDGYVDDLESGVAAVRLSLDGGATWTDFPTDGARTERGVKWSFVYTPPGPGRYRLLARTLSRAGQEAPTIESFTLDVLPARPARVQSWGSMALRPVGERNLEDAVLFRSRDLSALSPDEAVAIVNVLGVRSVYDVREAREVAASPDPQLPGARMLYVEPRTSARRRDAKHRLVAGVIGEYGAPEERMRLNYRRFASDYPLIGTVLRSIAATGSPALVHCRNGKDRTGVLCAVALRVAGCPRDLVMEDYLLSNKVNAAQIAAEEAELSAGMTEEEHAVLMSFLEARPSYLDAFFDEARVRHGSFERYVEEGLRLTAAQRARLREMLRS